MNRKDYESYYKKIDLLKIVLVLENPNAYNDIAVEVAKEELKSRDIPKEKYDEIKIHLNRKKEDSLDRSKRITTIKNKVKSEIDSKLESTIDAVNPLSINSASTSMKLVSSYFALSGIISLINQFDYLQFVIKEDDLNISYFEVYTIATIVFSIICGILLWKLKKIAWYMSILICITGIIFSMYSILEFDYIESLMVFGIPILIYAGIIYYLILESQRELFHIEKESVYKFAMIIIGGISLCIFVDMLINK